VYTPYDALDAHVSLPVKAPTTLVVAEFELAFMANVPVIPDAYLLFAETQFVRTFPSNALHAFNELEVASI
jgi:hypothetical protein